MFEHEPFKELPEAYIPFRSTITIPTLIFGFPITRDYREFRRIALAEGFISSEKCEDARMFRQMRLSVLRHLNVQCGLKPGGDIFGTGVSSLSTNYQQLVPEDKMDKVMRILKEYLSEVEPQWYLEADIDLKRIRTTPSMFLVICGGVTKMLTRVHPCPCLSGRSHRVYHSAARTLLL